MLIAFILTASLMNPVTSGASNSPARIVSAIDQNYLYADTDSWKHLRTDILADRSATVSSLNRQLAVLHDGDLRIMTAEQMAAMQAETAGKERGIGLVDFAVTVERSTAEPQVVTPLVDSPAFKAGLLPGDVIMAVNEQATRGLIHEDVIALLRSASKPLQVTIRRGSKRVLLHIPTATWQEQAVVFNDFMSSNQHLGYIGVRLFTPDSGDLVRKAVESLEARGVHKSVLDLRNNPGGYVDQMALAGSAFTDRVLGWKVRRDGTREPIHSSSRPFKTMQLAILVNHGTASAAEVLAAGLHDTLGARLIGAKTFGRGQIQTYVPIGDGAGIIIPEASIESAKGVQFNNGSGLEPDISIPSSTRMRTDDAAYQRAVELLTHG